MEIEKNIDYYHLRLGEIVNLVRLRKIKELEENRGKIRELIDKYKKNFLNHPSYNSMLPLTIEAIILN